MRSYWDQFVYCSPVQHPLSLDELLTSGHSADDDDALARSIADRVFDAAEQLEADEAANAVLSFVRSLRPREQQIVYRIFWLGETQASVARAFGVSRMAICKALKRISELGRAQLVECQHCALMQ